MYDKKLDVDLFLHISVAFDAGRRGVCGGMKHVKRDLKLDLFWHMKVSFDTGRRSARCCVKHVSKET